MPDTGEIPLNLELGVKGLRRYDLHSADLDNTMIIGSDSVQIAG